MNGANGQLQIRALRRGDRDFLVVRERVGRKPSGNDDAGLRRSRFGDCLANAEAGIDRDRPARHVRRFDYGIGVGDRLQYACRKREGEFVLGPDRAGGQGSVLLTAGDILVCRLERGGHGCQPARSAKHNCAVCAAAKALISAAMSALSCVVEIVGLEARICAEYWALSASYSCDPRAIVTWKLGSKTAPPFGWVSPNPPVLLIVLVHRLIEGGDGRGLLVIVCLPGEQIERIPEGEQLSVCACVDSLNGVVIQNLPWRGQSHIAARRHDGVDEHRAGQIVRPFA